MMGWPNDGPTPSGSAASTKPPPLVEVIREVRPQVLVTYDPNGFYGHPDHIQAHRVAWRAPDLAADPGFRDGRAGHIAKVYWTGCRQRRCCARSAGPA